MKEIHKNLIIIKIGHLENATDKDRGLIVINIEIEDFRLLRRTYLSVDDLNISL